MKNEPILAITKPIDTHFGKNMVVLVSVTNPQQQLKQRKDQYMYYFSNSSIVKAILLTLKSSGTQILPDPFGLTVQNIVLDACALHRYGKGLYMYGKSLRLRYKFNTINKPLSFVFLVLNRENECKILQGQFQGGEGGRYFSYAE